MTFTCSDKEPLGILGLLGRYRVTVPTAHRRESSRCPGSKAAQSLGTASVPKEVSCLMVRELSRILVAGPMARSL